MGFRLALPRARLSHMDRASDRIPIGGNGCYAVMANELNFQIFDSDERSVGLVWEVTGLPDVFRRVPTSNMGRLIPGGMHSSLVAAGNHRIENAIL